MRALLLVLLLAATASTTANAAEVPDGGCPPSDEQCVATPATPATPTAPNTPIVPTGSPAELGKWLATRIDAALAAPSLRTAKIGVAVIDIESGKPIYLHNESELLNPASNVKLFTTAAALSLLGPEFRWKTSLAYDGTLANGELHGRLYLRGTGDPTLVVEDLWKMVSDLWAHGVRKISGDLIVDDTYFDEVRLGPGFDQKQEDAAFRAPNGAVSLNYNAVAIHILPGTADAQPARVFIEPQTPYFVLHNEVRTVDKGGTSIVIESKDNDAPLGMDLTVRGRIAKRDAGRTEVRRISHPDLYTAYTLVELLNRRGIKLAGTIQRGAQPASAHVVVAHTSEPMSVVAREVNKRSQNFMAEQLLKTLGAEVGGRPGSWAKGVDAVAGYLEKIGIPRGGYKMQNGSGLYDTNRFTPLQAVTLLRAMFRDFRVSADFVGSLAVAGADGTISHRFEGTIAERQIRAKTGTLQGISCLAGYAGWPARGPVAFAVYVNGLSDGQTPQARAAQDEIAKSIVTYLSALK